MEFQRRIFLLKVKDDLTAPEVYPLGHPGQEIRHTSVSQCLYLRRQDFLQKNTVRIVFISREGMEGGDTVMNAKTAVARRIHALCLERNIAVNALANQCGIAPSTIYSMLNSKSKNPGIVSIQKICDGLEISVREFFDDPLFENLEQEIK